MKTFTLIPIGGLGNRINAICSAIVYCQANNRRLKIYWFKDQGLNCCIKDLFTIHPSLRNIELIDPSPLEYYTLDKARKKNFWIPLLYQKIKYDRIIYDDEVVRVCSNYTQKDFGDLEQYNDVFMVSYWRFWESPDMWKAIQVNPKILDAVNEVVSSLDTNRKIGIHFRGTDNLHAIKNSPIDLFVDKIMEEQALYGKNVSFYLATDEPLIKKQLTERFGDKIKTMNKPVVRKTKQGIIDAFTELNILARMDKIYASKYSSFSELAHFLYKNEFEEIVSKKDV